MNRHTISLCMIVKDEVQHIERCLKSCAAHVDEIVIVDTGSTDGTLDIVKRFGAKIYPFQWVHDFSAARNYALEHATCEYILVLDADEYLDEATDLQQDISSGADSYALAFNNYLTSGLVAHHTAIRLFKNHIGLSYFGRIHEHLNVEQLSVSKGQAGSLVHHDGYMRDTYEKKNKHQRNLQLLLRAVEENPSGYNLYNLGTQYRKAGQHAEAVQMFKRAYSLSKDKAYSYGLIYNMVDSLRELKRYQDALNVIGEAIAAFPQITDFHYVRGNVFEEAGYWPDAVECYNKCLELGDVKMDYSFQTFEGVGGYLARFRLGETYTKLGRKADALEQAFHAFRSNQKFLHSIRLYLSLMLETHIPREQAYENIKSVCRIATVEDLQQVLSVLYAIRHPLLDRFLGDYNLSVEGYITAAGKLYAKQYEEARRLWHEIGEAPAQSCSDVILLAVLLGDESLIARAAKHANYSKREWQVIKQAVRREETSGQLTGELEKLFNTLCTHAIILEEYEVFERLSRFVLRGSVNARLELAGTLVAYQFTDVAFDLLADLFEQQPNHVEVLVLLGDVCLQHQRTSDALMLYQRALELRPDYRSYYKLYSYYDHLQDLQGMQRVLAAMKQHFPESLWTKTHAAGGTKSV